MRSRGIRGREFEAGRHYYNKWDRLMNPTERDYFYKNELTAYVREME